MLASQRDDHALFVRGQWGRGSGPLLVSCTPIEEEVVWQKPTASPADVAFAVESAASAFGEWSRLSFAERRTYVERFSAAVQNNSEQLAWLISREMGKPLWEARTEIAAVVGKSKLAIEAILERRSTHESQLGDSRGVIRFRPLGVLGVLGPFNLPAHLPNGHIVPALLAGNTIVFKPSELTPAIGEWMVRVWESIGLPAGVINLVQGGRETGAALASHPGLAGLLFTGSYKAGQSLSQLFGPFPEKMLALEMGGNNPLIVDQVDSLDAACYLTIQSAYITSGQRCSCTRRLIVVENGSTRAFVERLLSWIDSIQVGPSTSEPQPFMGPVISRGAGERLQDAFQNMVAAGGKIVRPLESLNGNAALLRPGLIEMTGIPGSADCEHFGPLLQLYRVPTLEQAIDIANDTPFGLAAGLISNSRENYERFLDRSRAGVINWNRQTTGASGKLPFGGVGWSGNFRPSGYYAADYCSYPIASLESESLKLPEKLEPGLGKPSS